MLKWIRWSGLAGFAVVVGLIAAFWMLATPWLIRTAIESLGSKAAGARVEVKDVSMHYSPLGLEISGLTVANAKKPMENLVQFDRALADLEVGPLFLGKVIISEMSVNGLEFNTARTTSGALASKTSSASAASGVSAEPSVTDQMMAELPSAEEILARESLQTDAAGKALAETFERRKTQLNDTMATLPDQEKLAAYEAEIKALTANNITSLQDFQQRQKRLQELRDQFKADKKAINTAKDLIGETRIDITGKLTDLKNAPGDDLASIREKYQLNAQGAANLSGLLFGDDIGDRANQILYWYEKLSPWLDKLNSGEAEEQKEVRSIGHFVYFPSNDPWPDFLIRRARLSATTSAGKLLGEGFDITGQQRLLGRPMRFNAEGVDMPTVAKLDLALVIDHRTQPGHDTLTLTASDWALPATDLGIGETRLASASVQVQGMAQVTGKALLSKLDMQLGKTTFTGTGSTVFAKELTSALQTVGEFTINARAHGDLPSPTVELGSDLDRRLSAAFSKRLRAKQDELEARLQKRLDAKIDEYAGPYADDLKAINNDDSSLTERLARLEELGKAELKDYTDQKKQEARDKVKSEATDKLKKLL
jgi:uncharacterized protein (TIGR03545 family)